ncbi:MAG: transporter [Rhizobacter sp.]|nr:transporter [Rhizobacter sp.]
MSSFPSTSTALRGPAPTPAWMTLLLASACGLIVANLYYAQPLIGLIGPAIGLAPEHASLIVMLTQLGYCAGLVLLVPLGDLVENRRLTLVTVSGAVIALAVAAVAPNEAWFFAASLCIGLGSVAVQMLVPIASHMAPDASRGRMVGNVMSGLLLGIMLARPLSSLLASLFGWRAVFGISAVLIAVLAVVLRGLLPTRRPTTHHTYGELMRSLWTLLRDTPLLRRRAVYQAMLFASFSLFWTAVPLELAGPTFNLTQRGIAVFALLGAAGAISAPIAGRIADRGRIWSHAATAASLAMVVLSFLLARVGAEGSLAALVCASILLDLGVQANLVLGQRAIYALGEHTRSRLNGLYMAIFFLGGALGSALASIAYSRGGWPLVCWVGGAFPVVALLAFATEARPLQR